MVILSIIFLINWFMVFALIDLFAPSDLHAVIYSLLIMAGLTALAVSPLGEGIMRLQLGARACNEKEKQILMPLLEDVCHAAGQPVPKLYVCNQQYPNACAVGSKTVAITRGLLSVATKEELAGVLAHEIGHLANGDSRRLAIAVVLNLAGIAAAWLILFFGFLLTIFGDLVDRTGIIPFLLAIFLAILRLIINIIYKKIIDLSFLAVGRREEFRADAFAAQKTNTGRGLLSFLNRLKEKEAQPVGLWANLHSTHPATELRIERL